jgi:hypothetical protein
MYGTIIDNIEIYVYLSFWHMLCCLLGMQLTFREFEKLALNYNVFIDSFHFEKINTGTFVE